MYNIKNLKFLYVIFAKKTRQIDNIFKLTADEQKRYISCFSEPKDDIERSYFQYCCQMKLCGFLMKMLFNVVSLPLLLIFYFRRGNTLDTDVSDAMFITEGVVSKTIIPKVLLNAFNDWKEVINLKEFFTDSDKIFFKKILLRYPFSWHFLLKNLIKIRVYSYLVNSFQPKAIVVSNEYSFTSSVMTAYCNQNNVMHINVMHGEKLFFIRDSFFRFDKCYIWDSYYAELFGRLRTDLKQFVIAKPPALVFSEKRNIVRNIDYTYYLGGETGKQLKTIINNMRIIRDNGYIVALRPHPRYTDINELKTLIKRDFSDCIEDFASLTIEESILRTRHAIALYSTVLNQAYYNCAAIVIDNISNPEKFKKLYELQYIMLTKKHDCFSEILEHMSSKV